MAETKIEKNIKTRIKLKYGSYADLVNENPRLLDGEIAIACLTTAAATKPGETDTQHPVLFKVGGDKYPAGHVEAKQFKKFNDLPWASALAADVYEWAKKNGVHVTGNGNAVTAVEIDNEGYLAFNKGETFATKTDLENLRGDLEADTNTTYEFEIPAVGAENAGKLVIYKKEISGARALDKVLDIATQAELSEYIKAGDWYISEDGKFMHKDKIISFDHATIAVDAGSDETYIDPGTIKLGDLETTLLISSSSLIAWPDKINHSELRCEYLFPAKSGTFALTDDITSAVSAITPESLGLSSVMHFIGAYTSAPAKAFAGTDKERDVKEGDLYLNTLENKEYVRSNGSWVELGYPTDHSTELGLKLNANGWVDNTSKNGWVYDDKNGGETVIAHQSIQLGVDYFNRSLNLTPHELTLDYFSDGESVSLSANKLEFYAPMDNWKYAYEGARFTVQPDEETVYTINLPEASGELVVAESDDVVYIIDGNF